jgi:polysaccharide deacetylase 2 family uncharacterized protein YibQ
VYTQNHVRKQIVVVKKFLESNDRCIVIGHVGAPGLSTAAVLKSVIPELQKNVTFVSISHLMPLPTELMEKGIRTP